MRIFSFQSAVMAAFLFVSAPAFADDAKAKDAKACECAACADHKDCGCTEKGKACSCPAGKCTCGAAEKKSCDGACDCGKGCDGSCGHHGKDKAKTKG